MLTVLMVEDKPEVIEVLQEHFQKDGDVHLETEESFEKALEKIESLRPDVLILDWFKGDISDGERAGDAVWHKVWEKWFCPVIVYSAGEVELGDPAAATHPLVAVIRKSSQSSKAVVEKVASFKSHSAALRDVTAEFSRVGHGVLKHLVPVLFAAENDDGKRAESLKRAARRRAAAMMDDAAAFGGALAFPWEQYVFPVLTSHPLVGDVVQLTGSDQSPGNYRVILTPTCDMVPQGGGGGVCKVSHVLAATCCSSDDFVRFGLNVQPGTAKAKIRDKLKSSMNEAHQSGYALLPECPGALPLMAVNFKKLELLQVADIGNAPGDGKPFVRVASVDSPFREHLVWAYLQVGCRPGVPPRDMNDACEMVLEKFSPEAAKAK